jgi:glycine cleavage system H protein
MSEIPANLKYTRDHEWVRLEDDGLVTLGITDHAQQALGELVYVELPEIDQQLAPGDACAVVESVKAASDVYSPLSGTVAEVNESLEAEPERVNGQAYENGWLLRIRPEGAGELEEMMDAEAYEQFLAAESD